MKHRSWTTWTLACIGLLAVSAPSYAARWYQVEILVFENTDAAHSLTESWVSEGGYPDLNGTAEVAPGGGANAFPEAPRSSLRMRGLANSLAASGSRNVILHTAWRQPAANKDSAIPVRIHGGRTFTNSLPDTSIDSPTAVDQIDGTVLLGLSRFVHIYTDFYYRVPQPVTNVLSNFRVRDHRRMRSGEVHYLDHPLFGILIRVSPTQAASVPVPRALPNGTEPARNDDPRVAPRTVDPIAPSQIRQQPDRT